MQTTPAQIRYADLYDGGADLTAAQQAFVTTYTAISDRCARVKAALWKEDGLRGDEYRVVCAVAERARDVDQARALLTLEAAEDEPVVETYPNPTLADGRGFHAHDGNGNHGFGCTEGEARAAYEAERAVA